MLILLLTEWMFKLKKLQGWLLKHSAPLIILFVLVVISGVSFCVIYGQTNPINQSIAINLATDSLFAVFAIFGITGIESLRRRRENKAANELVYVDLQLELKKTMLKLLVALEKANEKTLIRTNFDYSTDHEIYPAFYDLVDHPDQLDVFLLGLYPERNKAVAKMVDIKMTISKGIEAVENQSAMIKPSPRNTRLIQQYSLWEIEDPAAYTKYLRDGEKYGSYYVYEKGRFTGAKTEIHTEEWDDILRSFKGDLIRDMKYLADIYDLCEQERL